MLSKNWSWTKIVRHYSFPCFCVNAILTPIKTDWGHEIAHKYLCYCSPATYILRLADGSAALWKSANGGPLSQLFTSTAVAKVTARWSDTRQWIFCHRWGVWQKENLKMLALKMLALFLLSLWLSPSNTQRPKPHNTESDTYTRKHPHTWAHKYRILLIIKSGEADKESKTNSRWSETWREVKGHLLR